MQLFLLVALLCAIASSATLYQGQFSSTKWLFDDVSSYKTGVESIKRFRQSQLTFIVAFKLHDTEKLHNEFISVSDPKSAKYGRFYSAQQLAKTFGPSKKIREMVLSYFGGIPGAALSIGDYGDLLEVTASIAEIETYLDTELGLVSHSTGQSEEKSVRAMSDLHIPLHIAEHISFVSLNTPVTHAKARGTRAVKQQEAKVGSQQASISTINGNDETIVRFQVYCADGTLNQLSPPCSDSANNAVQFTFTFTEHANNPSDPFLLTTKPTVYTMPSDDLYCYNYFTTATCNGNEATNCTCLTKLSPLPKYTQLLVNVTSTFPGSATPNEVHQVGVSNYFALTDVATPRFLSKLYNMPTGARVNHGSNQSVAEFYKEFYSNTDLTKFLALSGLPNATIPPENVYGDLPNNYNDPGGEAQLDIEYIMALAPGAETYFYSMKDYNPYDAVNQTNEGFLAYLQIVDSQEYPPLVHSLSYGDIESDVFNSSNPAAVEYATRCDQEFQQMGLRGLSLLFSSGDDGIGSAMIRDDPTVACSQAWPEWPASSPYVTAVGATVLTNKYLPVCGQHYAPPSSIPNMPAIQQLVAECTGSSETVCSSVQGGVITSGGGFSNVHDRKTTAPWQDDAVNTYLSAANSAAYPPLTYFNSSGRGYPDVSTYGSNYFIYLDNEISRESGTSASAPVFAAMVTMWNDMRLAYDMPPMGFIAPFLYSVYAEHPEAFRDIVTGDNACGVGGSLISTKCCEYSFAASPGWDAVTGLGTPDFQVIANLVLNEQSPFPSLGAYPDGVSEVITESDDDVKSEADAALGIGIAALLLAVFVVLGGAYCFYRKPKESLLGN